MFREYFTFSSIKHGADHSVSEQKKPENQEANLKDLEGDLDSAFNDLESSEISPDKSPRLLDAASRMMKNISSEVAQACSSNKISYFLRGTYLHNSSKFLKRRLEKNGIREADREAIFKIFKTAESGYCLGRDSAYDTQRNLEDILTQISDADEPALNPAEISRLYSEIYHNEPRKGHSRQSFFPAWNKFLDTQLENFVPINEQGTNAEDIGDAILSLQFFRKLKNVNSHRFLNIFDQLIDQYPSLPVLPKGLLYDLLDKLSYCSEEIIHNERRRNYLFELWLNTLCDNKFNDFSRFSPLFLKNLQTASQCHKSLIIESKIRHPMLSALVSLMPEGDKDQKSLLVNPNPTKKLELDAPFVLRRPELFNEAIQPKDREAAVTEMAQNIKTDSSALGAYLVFLADDFEKAMGGLDEERRKEIINIAIAPKSQWISTDILYLFLDFMDKHNFPDYCKQAVYNSVNFDYSQLKDIIESPADNSKYLWIYNRPDLLAIIHKKYYESVQGNDLRHFFFDVVSGRAEVDDLLTLVKAYNAKCPPLSGYELVNLFTGNLDRQYYSYFAAKICNFHVFKMDLDAALEQNLINQEDYDWFVGGVVRNSVLYNASEGLKYLLSRGHTNRQELLDNYLANAIQQLDHVRQYFNYNQIMDALTVEESTDYLRRCFDYLLASNSASSADVLTNQLSLAYLERAYPDEDERKNKLEIIMQKTFGQASKSYFIDNYFCNQQYFKILSPQYRQEFEASLFADYDLGCTLVLLKNIGNMSPEQVSLFARNFCERDDILSSASGFDRINFCSKFGDLLESWDPAPYLDFYAKILASKNLDGVSLVRLFNQELLLAHDDLRNLYVKQLEKFSSCVSNGGEKILLGLSVNGQSILDSGLVKNISRNIMESVGLSPSFYDRALESDKKNPSIYLDKELFDIGLDRLQARYAFEGLDYRAAVYYISRLAVGPFGLKPEQERKLCDAYLDNYDNPGALKALHDYFDGYSDLFTDLVIKKLEESKDEKFLSRLLQEPDCFSAPVNDSILNSFEKKFLNIDVLKNLCQHFRSNPNYVARIKTIINNQDNSVKEKYRLVMLDNDLLNAQDLKELYRESLLKGKESEVRQHVLLFADIIGVLVSRNRVDDIGNFLDKPNPETEKQLSEIAKFVEKYSLENKGRTIVVMLAAKEYLPDLDLTELIDKISMRLKKYTEVLDRYSYSKVPTGLRASIGMEYEVTNSIASGYQEITGHNFKEDIVRLSEVARIGVGRDAVHEIATKPAVNPYLMLLEMQILNDTDYLDFNFKRSDDYQKGAHGFHLTIGGESGLCVDDSTNFLQNIILAASWGGVQAGRLGTRANNGRGVSLRDRPVSAENNVFVFDQKTPAVELRSLSIDKMETWQRAVCTAYNGAIAIQALKKYTKLKTSELDKAVVGRSKDEFLQEFCDKNADPIAQEIVYNWSLLVSRIQEAIAEHNESFLANETTGYIDTSGRWIDCRDFGGEYNRQRFESIVESIDPTLSVEEYVLDTRIPSDKLFFDFDTDLSDRLTKINNLFLKPSYSGDKKKNSFLQGDQANAAAMLDLTKFGNNDIEYKSSHNYLESTVFDTAGDKRDGFYCAQGGSERMLTHAIQKALLEFNRNMETLLN